MAAILLMGAAGAPAARLCRDTKGLFTPCIGERPLPEHHRRVRDAAPGEAKPVDGKPVDPKSASPETASRTDRVAPVSQAERRPSRPPLVAKTKLCRDSKGLFTPCPR